MIYVLLYLAAVVTANLLVATFGPAISIINAVALIGLDLTARDRLHDAWHGRSLWRNMALLIGAGSLISYALNAGAGRIALASFVAFAVAGAADALVYQRLRQRGWLTRVNGSNIVGAAVDSLVFPTLAFGGLLPVVTVGQFVAKVAGGWLWSLVLGRREIGRVQTA